MGGAFAIWVMRRRIDLHLHRLRRPSYYETERMRRIGLTEDRRRIRRRTTLNPRPAAEQLREAFLHARDSVENMVRLGSLMEDLECYIDNSLVFGEDGKIIARKGGIRRYIQSEIPDLYGSYKTLMRYKALARRFRQAVGISDPVSAASVLPEDGEIIVAKESAAESSKDEKIDKNKVKTEYHDRVNGVENMLRTNSQGDRDSRRDDGREAPDCGRDGLCDGGGDEYGVANEEKAQLNDKVRKVVGEILDVCEGTFLNLSAVVALRICEDTIPHRRYQGVRHDSGLANH